MILDQILAATRLRVEALKTQTDLLTLEKGLDNAPLPRPFAAALKHPDRLGLIAEIKKPRRPKD